MNQPETPLNKFTSEQLEELKAEFNKLHTIEEKFNFWSEKLQTQYLFVGWLYSLPDVLGFVISPRSEEEKEVYNLLIFEQAELLDSLNTRSRILYFEKLQESLNQELLSSKNPLLILEKVLKELNEEHEKNKELASPDNTKSSFETKQKMEWWLHGFKEYYQGGREIDLRHNAFMPTTLQALHNGCETAKYRLFVERRLQEVENKQTLRFQNDLPLKRQLLIMEYLGMLKPLNNILIKDKEKILSMLLNKGENSIKTDLSKLGRLSASYGVRTKENYQFLFNLFEETGLNQQAQEVKKELDKLSEAKK